PPATATAWKTPSTTEKKRPSKPLSGPALFDKRGAFSFPEGLSAQEPYRLDAGDAQALSGDPEIRGRCLRPPGHVELGRGARQQRGAGEPRQGGAVRLPGMGGDGADAAREEGHPDAGGFDA